MCRRDHVQQLKRVVALSSAEVRRLDFFHFLVRPSLLSFGRAARVAADRGRWRSGFGLSRVAAGGCRNFRTSV
jgi:hypothetical protein